MYPIKRTPEQGHSATCLANAITWAIKKEVEDLERAGETVPKDYYFRLAAQRNDFLHQADQALAEGAIECLCPPYGS